MAFPRKQRDFHASGEDDFESKKNERNKKRRESRKNELNQTREKKSKQRVTAKSEFLKKFKPFIGRPGTMSSFYFSECFTTVDDVTRLLNRVAGSNNNNNNNNSNNEEKVDIDDKLLELLGINNENGTSLMIKIGKLGENTIEDDIYLSEILGINHYSKGLNNDTKYVDVYGWCDPCVKLWDNGTNHEAYVKLGYPFKRQCVGNPFLQINKNVIGLFDSLKKLNWGKFFVQIETAVDYNADISKAYSFMIGANKDEYETYEQI